MPAILQAEDLLRRPGTPVHVLEETPGPATAALARCARISPWLQHSVTKTAGGAPRVIVRGGNVDCVVFEGAIEGRMLESFVLFVAELSRRAPSFDTPATPALLRELSASKQVTVVVSPSCPMCPSVLDAVLRFAQATPLVRVTVARPEALRSSPVRSTPTVVVDGQVVATGVIDEFALAQRVRAR